MWIEVDDSELAAEKLGPRPSDPLPEGDLVIAILSALRPSLLSQSLPREVLQACGPLYGFRAVTSALAERPSYRILTYLTGDSQGGLAVCA